MRDVVLFRSWCVESGPIAATTLGETNGTHWDNNRTHGFFSPCSDSWHADTRRRDELWQGYENNIEGRAYAPSPAMICRSPELSLVTWLRCIMLWLLCGLSVWSFAAGSFWGHSQVSGLTPGWIPVPDPGSPCPQHQSCPGYLSSPHQICPRWAHEFCHDWLLVSHSRPTLSVRSAHSATQACPVLHDATVRSIHTSDRLTTHPTPRRLLESNSPAHNFQPCAGISSHSCCYITDTAMDTRQAQAKKIRELEANMGATRTHEGGRTATTKRTRTNATWI